MKTHRRIWCVLFLLVATGGITSPATAQTPDDEPPSLEAICDLETGAAYGTCNAYCEAMDCELLTDGNPETSPNASEKACMRVKANFVKKTGIETLPCEVEDCPVGELGCPCFPDGSCDEGECDDTQTPPTCEEPM